LRPRGGGLVQTIAPDGPRWRRRWSKSPRMVGCGAVARCQPPGRHSAPRSNGAPEISAARVPFSSRSGSIIEGAGRTGPSRLSRLVKPYDFWVDALAIGRRDEARSLFVDLLAHRNAFGLLSEDIHRETGALRGNIPQSYSMAGIINSAMRLSVRWEGVWCRGSS
jgi:hypothetical protein